MNKKMENLVRYLLKNGKKYKLDPVCHMQQDLDGKYFITDGNSLVVLKDPEGLPVETDKIAERLAKTLWYTVNGRYGDLTKHYLPEAAYIKAKVAEVRGGKRFSVGCRFAEDFPALNADYIIKGMEALNATKLFFVDGNMNAPVMLFKDDEPWNAECLLVLPIYCHKTGYWEQPE